MIFLYYQGCKFTSHTSINGNLWIILMLGKTESWAQNCSGRKNDQVRGSYANGCWPLESMEVQ